MGLATGCAEARVDEANNPRDDGGMAATRTTDYAVRALVALALEGGSGRVKQASALAQVSGGGYELARPAEKIRMSEVVAWVDGGRNARGVARGDAVGEVWGKLQSDAAGAASKVLAAETLARLVERVRAKLAAKGRTTEYQI